MKKTLLTFIIMLALMHVNAQLPYIPYNYTSSGNTNLSTGFIALQGHDLYLGPFSYNITGAGQLVAKATHEIHLQPESHLSPNSAGLSHLFIDADQLELVSFHPNGFSNIPTYCRFELGLKLPSSIQSQINTFLNTFSTPVGNTIPGLNPYDRDQVKIACTVNTPSGNSFTRYAFYYQPYTVSNNTYFEGTTDFPFRIRMAPPEVGAYVCNINIFINGSPVMTWNGIKFDAVSSGSHGNLVMAPSNLQKMRFEDGTFFYGMGQNLAPDAARTWNPDPSDFYPWDPNQPHPPRIHNSQLNPSFDYDYGPSVKPSPATQENCRQALNDLADNRSNFVRLRIDPWTFPLEYADKRSLAPNRYDTYNCITNYQPNQMFLWEFDKTLAVCEERGVYMMLNLMQDQIFSGAAGMVHWEDFPYSVLLNEPQDPNGNPTYSGVYKFYSDNIAKKTFKKQLDYINARWGYSTNIAMWEMINETENNSFYDAGNTNPNQASADLRLAIRDWVCEMATYVKTAYPAHLTTNGTTTQGFTQLTFAQSCLDIYSGNDYNNEVNPGTKEHFNFKDAYHEGGTSCFQQHMPFLHGEIGLGVSCQVPGWPTSGDPHMVNRWADASLYNGRSFHNNIWSTTVNGNLATGLNFFDGINSYMVYYKALNNFVSKIQWDKVLTPQRYGPPGTGSQNVKTGFSPGDPTTHVLYNLYMMDESTKDYVVGWSMIHPSFWTYDESYSSFPDFNNLIDCINYDPASNPPDYNVSPNLGDAAIVINNMSLPNHWYKMRIFDPYDETISSSINYVQSGPAPNNKLVFHLPFWNHRNDNSNNVGPDRAYIIYDNDKDFRSDDGGTRQTEPEVVQYTEDLTDDDSDQHVRGRSSSQPVEIITYENGKTVKRKITDLAGYKNLMVEAENVNAFPNPANSFVSISFNDAYFTNTEIALYDLTGKLLRRSANTKQIDVRDLDHGIYLVKFKSDQVEKSFKISVGQ